MSLSLLEELGSPVVAAARESVSRLLRLLAFILLNHMSKTMSSQASLARRDKFISILKDMQSAYPEYNQILRLLIEQVENGKLLAIQKKLQQLKEESW